MGSSGAPATPPLTAGNPQNIQDVSRRFSGCKNKNPFGCCVKVLLEIIEVCERGRGCCCPKRPPGTPNPPHHPSQVRRLKQRVMECFGWDNEGSGMAESLITQLWGPKNSGPISDLQKHLPSTDQHLKMVF